jgi:hypothetical protein
LDISNTYVSAIRLLPLRPLTFGRSESGLLITSVEARAKYRHLRLPCRSTGLVPDVDWCRKYEYIDALVMVIEMNSPILVLATVNAPYSKQLNAQELVYCLLDHAAAKAVPGHMSSFFGEVKPELQCEFADLFGISHAQLVEAAKAFSSYSGESYPLAA